MLWGILATAFKPTSFSHLVSKSEKTAFHFSKHLEGCRGKANSTITLSKTECKSLANWANQFLPLPAMMNEDHQGEFQKKPNYQDMLQNNKKLAGGFNSF